MNIKTKSVIIIAIFALTIFYSVRYLKSDKKIASVSLSDSVILQVPFSPQAPTDKWDRNEDCEETSIVMANAFLTGTTQNKLDSGAALEAIGNLKKWENGNLGYNADTGADSTTRMAEGAFGLKVKQIRDFTKEDLKRELSNNLPILLPIDARVLNNPKYANSGPQYHMILIRGYKNDTFIINDPGTNSGNGNEYNFETLLKAASDWNQTTQSMDPNRKTALVVYK